MSDPTVSQIIAGMPSRFKPENAIGMDAVIQFNLSGTDGGKYYAIIKDGACSLHEGAHDKPNITLKMSDQTYIDMVMGRITGQQAFFTRKLRYDGDISLAVKMNRLFEQPEKI